MNSNNNEKVSQCLAIIINRDSTALDDEAAVVVHDDLAAFAEQLEKVV